MLLTVSHLSGNRVVKWSSDCVLEWVVFHYWCQCNRETGHNTSRWSLKPERLVEQNC